MARRQGAESFESNKKARKLAKKANRIQETRNERETLLIACEDSKSAPLYFRAIFNDLKNNHAIAAASLVIATHQHTNTDGVLHDLLNYPNYQDFTHQWIVIDRDEERTNGGGHTLEDFKLAIARAASNKVKVAYANPCFEIWYLLHFNYRDTPINRDELCEILEKNYQYAKNKLFNQVINDGLQTTAIRNAQRLILSWIDSQGKISPATDNPSTTVHELVELLNGFRSKNDIA